MDRRKQKVLLVLFVVLVMGVTACDRHLPVGTDTVHIQVVTRGSTGETEKEETSSRKETMAEEITTEETETSKALELSQEETTEAVVTFQDIRETVTAKNIANLMTEPESEDESTVAATLKYGDTAIRTGIGDNGWSRVVFQGKTLYVQTSFLTTDLKTLAQTTASQTTESQEESARNRSDEEELPETTSDQGTDSDDQVPYEEETKDWDFAHVGFKACHEEVTPKIETNLRTEPSTRSDDTVVIKLRHGEVVIRTGIGSNGWSRVEYNGQTLYAVTSYLTSPDQ